jgi:hypothetical protein
MKLYSPENEEYGGQHPLWRSQFRPATTPRRSRGASHCAGGNGGEIHGEGGGGGGEEWPRHLVEREVAGVVPRERGDAADGQLGGVVEVVDDDGAEAREEELQHGVATDVARPARDQHGPPRTRAGQRLLHRHGSLARAASLPQPQAATYLPARPPAPASASSTRARAKGGGRRGGPLPRGRADLAGAWRKQAGNVGSGSEDDGMEGGVATRAGAAEFMRGWSCVACSWGGATAGPAQQRVRPEDRLSVVPCGLVAGHHSRVALSVAGNGMPASRSHRIFCFGLELRTAFCRVHLQRHGRQAGGQTQRMVSLLYV